MDAGQPDAGMVVCPSTLTGWQRLGTALSAISTAGTSAAPPSVTVDRSNMPIVAWAEGEPADLHIYRFGGTSWDRMGAALSENPGNSPVFAPRLASQGGSVVLAYAEAGGGSGTGFYARRWDGRSWQQMGGGELSTTNASVSGGASYFMSNGDVLVAWSQYSEGSSGRNRVQVRQFTGTAYQPLLPELGGVSGASASAISPEIVIDARGAVVVAFSESGVRVVTRTPQNDGWQSIGDGVVSAAGSSIGAHSPRLALDRNGNPLVAMAEYDSGTQTNNGYVMSWTGSAWQQMGQALDALPGAQSYMQSVVVDDMGRPVVAWLEGDSPRLLHVRRWNGTGFEPLGDDPLSAYGGTGSVAGASLAMDVCGRVVIAFTEAEAQSSDQAIQVYRYFD